MTIEKDGITEGMIEDNTQSGNRTYLDEPAGEFLFKDRLGKGLEVSLDKEDDTGRVFIQNNCSHAKD